MNNARPTTLERALRRADELPVEPGWNSHHYADVDYDEAIVGFARACVRSCDPIFFGIDRDPKETAEALVAYFDEPRKWRRERALWARTGLIPEEAEDALLAMELREEEEDDGR